jgi:hypothetical protein
MAEAVPCPEAGPLLAEADEIFEQLEAKPWLERAEKVGEAAPAPP